MHYIDAQQLEQLAQPMSSNSYGSYLLDILTEGRL